jgi:hypothetical protein
LNEGVEIDKRQFTSALNANIKFDEIDSNDVTELQALRASKELTDPLIESWNRPFLYQDKSNSLGNPVTQTIASRRINGLAAEHQKQLRKRRLHRSETDCSMACNSSFPQNFETVSANKRSYQLCLAVKK